MTRFLSLPDSLCHVCPGERFTRIQLLEAAGRDAEAARRLHADAIAQQLLGVGRLLWVLERARVNDRLGNTAEATEAYAYVVSAWRHADPELQPLVDEARRALARLAGEPR